MPFAILSPRPVAVTTPTIMPAQPQVTATDIAPLAVSSRQRTNFFKNSRTLNRLVSRTISITQIIRHEIIPYMAAFIADRPITSSATITMIGATLYQPVFSRYTTSGLCSFGIPSRPFFTASKCTLVKIPVKYRSAGIQAARAMVP